MLHRPAFKPHYRVEILKGEGVFLLSEHGHFLLTGDLIDKVAPLLDGHRTADEIADLLEADVPMEHVYYTLARLEKEGHLAEADHETPASIAAFWSAFGFNGQTAQQSLAHTFVTLHDIGTGFRNILERALYPLEIRPAKDPDNGHLTIVIVEDYLRAEIADINAQHVLTGRPWIIAKPDGLTSWLGPIFVPGRTGCWACLAQRLQEQRDIETLLKKRGRKLLHPFPQASLPATIEQSINMLALQVAMFVVRGSSQHLEGRVITSDLANFCSQAHVLVRRPQCSACGSRALTSKDGEASQTSSSGTPPDFRLRPHEGDNTRQLAAPSIARPNNQHAEERTQSPEETFECFRHHISPITGVVSGLAPASGLDGTPLHVYLAGHNFALSDDSISSLRAGLRSHSSGKGITDMHARTSALCEAIERYSGKYRGDEPTVRATYSELGVEAIHPNSCMLFSERQYLERQSWLNRNSYCQIVPLPFPEDVDVEWSPIRSLTDGSSRFLPTGYLYYSYPQDGSHFFYGADSNGNAAGNTPAEAIQQGFLELVERDSVCVWWYNRLSCPAVNLESLDDPYVEDLQRFYASQGREFWVLDLRTDTGIPAFAAVNRRLNSSAEDIILGFGAHLDARTGVMRAITEMNQFMPAVLSRHQDGSTNYGMDDAQLLQWWGSATVANQPYLQPSTVMPLKLKDYSALAVGDAEANVRKCVSIASGLGMETLVLDQTRPDVGLPVVKVIVPGLRHFWARFAPGRLYDVPVRMGWLDSPTPEAVLNPIAMFV